jgi:ADP-ribosylglycohydrolase
MPTTKTLTLSGLIGVCVGDALGVPVEFSTCSNFMKQWLE